MSTKDPMTRTVSKNILDFSLATKDEREYWKEFFSKKK
jgi:hypothetical protein